MRGISTSPGSSSTCRRPESLESRPGRARDPRARTSAAPSDVRRCDRGSAASTAPRSFSLRGSRAALPTIRGMDPRLFVLGFSVAALAIWARTGLRRGRSRRPRFARGPTADRDPLARSLKRLSNRAFWITRYPGRGGGGHDAARWVHRRAAPGRTRGRDLGGKGRVRAPTPPGRRCRRRLVCRVLAAIGRLGLVDASVAAA